MLGLDDDMNLARRTTQIKGDEDIRFNAKSAFLIAPHGPEFDAGDVHDAIGVQLVARGVGQQLPRGWCRKIGKTFENGGCDKILRPLNRSRHLMFCWALGCRRPDLLFNIAFSMIAPSRS